MDMIFFPHNSMFAYAQKQQLKSSTYAVKVNNQLIRITDKPYWKKDFLEMSLSEYAKYIKNDSSVALHYYLSAKGLSSPFYSFLSHRLLPQNTHMWFIWYLGFAGIKRTDKIAVDLYEYQLTYNQHQPVITDSTLVASAIYE